MKKQLLRTKIVGVTAIVLIVLLGWLLLLRPAANRPAQIAEKTVAAETAESATLAQIAAAREQILNLPELQANIEAVDAQFPSTVDPALIEEKVAAVAAAAGLPPGAVVTVTPGPVTAYQDPAEAAAQGSGGGDAAAAPSPSAPPSGENVVLQQAVSIQISGSLTQIGAFADTLGDGSGFAVRGVTTTTDAKTGQYLGTIDSLVFLLPPLPDPPSPETLAAILNEPEGAQ